MRSFSLICLFDVIDLRSTALTLTWALHKRHRQSGMEGSKFLQWREVKKCGYGGGGCQKLKKKILTFFMERPNLCSIKQTLVIESPMQTNSIFDSLVDDRLITLEKF